MAEGVTSRDKVRDREARKQDLAELAREAHEANKVVGSTSLTLLDFPDNRMDSLDRLEVIKAVEAFIAQHNPHRVYTHYGADVNIDHQVVYEAVITACRPQPECCVKDIICFEVNSSTDWRPAFLPNLFHNVEAYLPLKLKA
jgi:LmbE family N-acetylglucosaminyl deacetylase